VILPDDIFLVSYPRSGNTWLRFLIANLLDTHDAVTFLNIDRKVGDIYGRSQENLLRLPRPRILKSHEPFEPRYSRVLYIVRDPRDVAVSYYHWKMKRRVIADGYPIEQFVSHFLAAKFDPNLGTWAQNVGTWLAARQNTVGFMLIRYEDLFENTLDQLRRIAQFLNCRFTEEQLSRAILLSTVERMQDLEKRQSHLWVGGRGFRQDIMFVRKGQTGSWQSELPPTSVLEIDRAWGAIMKSLGYNCRDTAALQKGGTRHAVRLGECHGD